MISHESKLKFVLWAFWFFFLGEGGVDTRRKGTKEGRSERKRGERTEKKTEKEGKVK